EHWHLGDGNYPAFAVGDEARLSFELDVSSVELLDEDLDVQVLQQRDAEYEIVGYVLRQYPDGVSSTFPVIEAGSLRFYCPAGAAADLSVGTKVRLRGRFALDHYQWVEFLERYADPPNLFYAVRVVRVRQVRIPSHFISRSERSLTYPAVVASHE